MDFLRSLSKIKSPLFYLLLLLLLSEFGSVSAFNLTTIPFEEGYSPLFGDFNIDRSPDDKSVRLLLDRYSGSGFISTDLYQHGFFSANIKLPSDYTAGIVVAFYTSNGDVYEKTHDELDFEFLGDIEGRPWRFQTNMYGNGSTNRGREERYRLWFDPTQDFHRYSILWTANKIIFYVDTVPIREIIRSDEMGTDFPSKPMALYATIWDASTWATSGGKYKVDYRYAPFVSEFTDLVLQGCPVNPTLQQFYPISTSASCSPSDTMLETADFYTISEAQRKSMGLFRERYMYYSYCYDTWRYSVPPPECVIVASERRLFKESGRLRFEGRWRKPTRRRSRGGRVASRSSGRHADML